MPFLNEKEENQMQCLQFPELKQVFATEMYILWAVQLN